MATQPIQKLTEEEYLEQERASETKHELIAGEVFAMSGGSRPHCQLAANFIIQIGRQLGDRDCIVYTSDVRVRTSASGSYVYPDVSVACGPATREQKPNDILVDPKLVVEVLSPATANYDRGKKFSLYREIRTLGDYLLIDPDAWHVEHYARQADASWIFREYREAESVIELPAMGCRIRLGDLYRNVTFEAQSQEM